VNSSTVYVSTTPEFRQPHEKVSHYGIWSREFAQAFGIAKRIGREPQFVTTQGGVQVIHLTAADVVQAVILGAVRVAFKDWHGAVAYNSAGPADDVDCIAIYKERLPSWGEAAWCNACRGRGRSVVEQVYQDQSGRALAYYSHALCSECSGDGWFVKVTRGSAIGTMVNAFKVRKNTPEPVSTLAL
jgi:hypothetical protein